MVCFNCQVFFFFIWLFRNRKELWNWQLKATGCIAISLSNLSVSHFLASKKHFRSTEFDPYVHFSSSLKEYLVVGHCLTVFECYEADQVFVLDLLACSPRIVIRQLGECNRRFPFLLGAWCGANCKGQWRRDLNSGLHWQLSKALPIVLVGSLVPLRDRRLARQMWKGIFGDSVRGIIFRSMIGKWLQLQARILLTMHGKHRSHQDLNTLLNPQLSRSWCA